MNNAKEFWVGGNIVLLILLILVSCKNIHTPESNGAFTHITPIPQNDNRNFHLNTDSLFYSCFHLHDTLINGISINYIIKDTAFVQQLTIAGIKKNIFTFNCGVAADLVPEYYSSYQSQVCFIRGYGFDFREFFVFYPQSGQVIEKRYETALAANMRDSIVVYKNDTTEDIVVENIRTGKQKRIVLPIKYRYEHIINTSISRSNLKVEFVTGKKLKLKVSR